MSVWTPSEVDQAILAGDSLLICDNLVLRTSGYEKFHPGGKFALTKNVGRDISKFYYGNYKMTSGKHSKAHTHSG